MLKGLAILRSSCGSWIRAFKSESHSGSLKRCTLIERLIEANNWESRCSMIR